MNTVAELIQAVALQPNETTARLVLADALDEDHPHNSDGRATILRAAVTHPFNYSGKVFYALPAEYRKMTLGVSRVGGGAINFGHSLSVLPDGAKTIVLSTLLHEKFDKARRGRRYKLTSWHTTLPHAEARAVADNLPDAADVHAFLDQHCGPDPRTAAKFARALNAVPKA